MDIFCSTIIPTINRSTLSRAIQSVLDQSFQEADFEVIVVNDSGQPLPDAAWQHCERVQVINTNRHERSVARNTGAAIARGKYLHFLDDDDCLLPDAMEAFWSLDQEKGTDAVWLYGSYRTVNNEGELIEEFHPNIAGNIFALLVAGEGVPLQASLLQANAFFAAGGFDPAITGVEDRDLGRRLALLGDIAYIPQVVARIRIGEVGSTTDWGRVAEDDRWGREKALSAPHSFGRVRASANSKYWYGRVSRAYFASSVWNLKRLNILTALRRGMAGLFFAGGHVIWQDFWSGLKEKVIGSEGNSKMRIGIDARFLTHPQLGGFKTYTENLIAALAEVDQDNLYFLYLDRKPDHNTKLPDKPNFTYRVVPAVIPFLGVVWREQFRLPRQAARDKLDLFHSPCLSAPLIIGCPTAVTVHDVIWHSPEKFAGHLSKPSSIKRRLQDWYYRIVPNLAIRNAQALITVSESSKRDIVQLLNVPSEKIHVTYEAASDDFHEISDDKQIASIRLKYDLASDFILALGSADPRKNISQLLNAYVLLPAAVQDRHQLVIVWSHGFLASSIDQAVERSGLSERVKFLEWIPNGDLVLLFNAAALFVFPSRYEGFGLPLLEAMACGTPIVAANNSSIPEIVDDAALLTEADDAHALAETIALVLNDESLRTDLIAKGYKRAEFFSWNNCALQTIDVYKQAFLGQQLAQASLERSHA